jgi:hypothetical protein
VSRERDGHGQTDHDLSVQVDHVLRDCIAAVESAVVTYLVRITDASREALVHALEDLDAETAAGDAYRGKTNAIVSLTGMAGLGSSSLRVIGQTSRFPVVLQVPVSVFQAQIALVRAAKDEVRDATPQTFEALDSACRDLGTLRQPLDAAASPAIDEPDLGSPEG